MSQPVNYCPLCHHENSQHFETRQFRGHAVTNRVCENCGLVFQSPRMSTVELDEFYAAEYRQIYQGVEGPTTKDLRTQEGRASALLKFAQDFVPQVERHLDIGCSTGILLEFFHDHYGSQPVGVEPGDAYRKFAQEKGITVYADIENLLPAGEKCCDLISMTHVLEHLSNPVGYLTYLGEKYLTKGGWLLIEVPNLYCHDSFEIAHLVSFSAHTLRQTLQRAGFEVVKLKAHGQPRSELLPLYLTVLARPSQRSGEVIPEKYVARKRQFGMFYRRVVQKLFPKKAWLYTF
jgi:SAM-dependent methyltransferase